MMDDIIMTLTPLKTWVVSCHDGTQMQLLATSREHAIQSAQELSLPKKISQISLSPMWKEAPLDNFS
jgi:hypothetical protein